MENIPDSVLLKIFSYFQMTDLLRLSRVNSDWRRVAHDWYLWREVSLAKFSRKMPDLTLRKLIKNFFHFTLKYLDLSNFNISSRTLHLLSQLCPKLQTLILEYANFHESYEQAANVAYFPRNLKELNVMHTFGAVSIYRNITQSLETHTLEGLHVGNSFTELFLENERTVLNFFLRQGPSIKFLEFSFCIKLDDHRLKQILVCCRNLKSLAVRRCQNIRGNFLRSVFEVCPFLRSLLMEGSMITDEHIKKIKWSRCLLTDLDLSRCRSITADGLMHILPELKFLRYLKVSRCGYGHALTDNVLREMARNSCKFLQILDVCDSFAFTKKGLEELLQKCHNLREVYKTNCPNFE